MMLFAVLACTIPVVQAQPTPACSHAAPFNEPIARAAARFALPDALIHTVIAVESNFAVFAVSPKGARGLMQLMPGTWEELRLRHGLGADPFDPCDNILAGSAYLRELLDRYGDPGFLAAYNAGPGRYESYLRGARPLPAETIGYMSRIPARMRGGVTPMPARPMPDPDAWRRGDLFVRTPPPPPEADGENAKSSSVDIVPDTLFITRTAVPR